MTKAFFPIDGKGDGTFVMVSKRKARLGMPPNTETISFIPEKKGPKTQCPPFSGDYTLSAKGTGLKLLEMRESDKVTPAYVARFPSAIDERGFAKGLEELARGNHEAALACFRKNAYLADAAFTAGLLAFRAGDYDTAEKYLTSAIEEHSELDLVFIKYGVCLSAGLGLNRRLTAYLRPDVRSILLVLAELYRCQKNWVKARTALERLVDLHPEDALIVLFLCEIMLQTEIEHPKTIKKARNYMKDVSCEGSLRACFNGCRLLIARKSITGKTLPIKKNRRTKLYRARAV
ncbi:MAG: hypothetical protein A2268_01440 [Candidatus Raymondbacteria bacterium RifOxyA12_full_50_37]|uniref:Tetratricopeptide repeat protein n=1 Tax=Candidatus Raymondbacteria bacterium RIFOXYD12_FULL_49_13 TaxID=1817890 RepID=A0A1F7F9X2_UNCRA|nr:MAG: hypothetical protein A2268_01440 [Candidatus Raymondbacteria bacterium RifOxyA12_full_50_37]OGJ87946.1 MAG: hypothetical protein A2248_01895 [Candidatus Raymondbacteria bacterium RIFOXYA2_FULL_49_16]OGJ95627.1 MAG: hypothetical protein A2453_13135 [Candidatus Raymondbacteria bacterium RIFOXYC2_FULL_50_21]OGJ97645.1 MAG: hypothetical protein A2487_13005 [Candidatus Raymondbacteria bacterium RifOxyC12_full_50_8]OGK03401.1 MAG: hypothetical protein A2519_15410 [Candidatus Raymondbacteria b